MGTILLHPDLLHCPGVFHQHRDPPICMVTQLQCQAAFDNDLRFEKSLYDLIRGLRNHKGNEREYIQNSLRECRAEIRGSDMDLKATALLKLIYLEMFGHDMSWASFHVLEVMSCQKYAQKRVGYLAAVQSFRPDTEVLMLATNLLKKDISSSLAPTMSLPLVTLPHIITSSLALSLLSDLLPRLSHSSPNIRKKTVAALYRLALVYPDALRSAWPKIKDLLLDEEQDSSVTAAVVNVICELGWRRPRDFLALAPRLFDLLVEGGNNWMAIKIIKLFATLTPLEPRLTKKLLPPLAKLIRTTPAMSLLYECINGVIQGGILEGTDGIQEGDEIASLCVGKLRGMIVVEGDPNLKYVALLAFNRIVVSHPHLVLQQQDVIMSCIDDPDVSIRLKALELGAGMVNSDNLVALVERLMRQLQQASISNDSADDGRTLAVSVQPAADSDGEDPEESLRPSKEPRDDVQALPAEYRNTILQQILDMCSKDTYLNIVDFEWYIDTLLRLLKLVPAVNKISQAESLPGHIAEVPQEAKVSSAIGWELRNVAVRVNIVRPEVVKAADVIIAAAGNNTAKGLGSSNQDGVLSFVAWIAGEYIEDCENPAKTLDSLICAKAESLPSDTICAYLQAIPKVFAHIVSKPSPLCGAERKTMTSLLLARIVHFLEPLATHPNLEVQERAVEYLELMKVVAQATSGHEPDDQEGPLLLTRAVPQLFADWELNPVAPTAQKKVPVPADLDLETPFNSNLLLLLKSAEDDESMSTETAEFDSFYNQRPAQKAIGVPSIGSPAIDGLPSFEVTPSSYQQTDLSALDAEALIRTKIQRRERNKDDPFYIGSEDASSGASTPFHEILRNANGDDVDVDSIPIMDLDLGTKELPVSDMDSEASRPKRRRPKRVHIAQDETIGHEESSETQNKKLSTSLADSSTQRARDQKKNLLMVDSSGLGGISLEIRNHTAEPYDDQVHSSQDTEMEKALAEVERLRLEMQRASERIQAVDGTPAEGTLVKKKEKKKTKGKAREDLPEGVMEAAQSDEQATGMDGFTPQASQASVIVQPRVKKKKRKKLARVDGQNGSTNRIE